MSARPTEKWLSSKDHEQWASAMMACKSGAPWECAQNEACRNDGECFTTQRQAACAAWRMIQNLQSDNTMVQAELDRAVSFLRDGKGAA